MKSFVRFGSLLLFIAITVYCEIQGRSSRFRCDYTYNKLVSGYLKFHEIPSNWQDARLRCDLEGGVLVSPLNSALSTAIKDIVQKNCPKCGIFTGIHATISRGDFYSIDVVIGCVAGRGSGQGWMEEEGKDLCPAVGRFIGVPLSKIPHTWAVNEPNACDNNERCVIVLPDGTMADVNCLEAYPYICYKKALSNMVVNPCGTTDNEYTLDARTGSCYKFHRVPRTWSRAYMACSAEGGYLAILNNEIEAQVIRDVFSKNPGGSMVGNFWKDGAFVGVYDWNEHGDWRTINGETLQAAGYARFAGGQPNNATTGEYCGYVLRNAELGDILCENSQAFICEKNPGSLLCNFEETEKSVNLSIV